MAKAKKRKCHICDLRPAATERGFCTNCQNIIDAEKQRKRDKNKPLKYVTYRGVTVALFQDGGDRLKPQFVTLNPERIPRSRLINLDEYCDGFTRQQVKKLKRLCLSFAK